MPKLSDPIKRAALEAVEAGKPVNIVFGTVLSASPIQINVEQKMTLGAKQLILSRNVTDYTVMMTVDHATENDAFMKEKHTHQCSCALSSGTTDDGNLNTVHKHEYKGTKAFLIHNALKAGETVILIRVQGGQKFLVLDRLGV